jgi:hypothetical protein
LIIFVGGTNGSVNEKIFNDNLEELQVLESKRNAIRKGLDPRWRVPNGYIALGWLLFLARTNKKHHHHKCGDDLKLLKTIT